MKKSVFVAVVGRPNVGKSSLVNGLLNKEISIVSQKPQTTRNKIAAIKTIGESQFVFFDTPGLFKARDVLGNRMVKAVGGAINDVDCVVLVVEPKAKISPAELDLIDKIKSAKVPAILAINKIDLIKNKANLIPVAKAYNDQIPTGFHATVFLSVKAKQGFDSLMFEVQKHQVQGVHFFPDDMLTDKTDEFNASEIFRQKLLLNLKQEVPHNLIVEVDSFKKTKTSLNISIVIYCAKTSHKGIVIGKEGLLLKKIATESRLAMQLFFECDVNLKCWVKVKPKWKNNEKFLIKMGL